MSEPAKNIDVFGVDELNEFFAGMERSDQRRVILDAFRIGSKPLIDAAKQLLKAAIKTKSKRNLEKSMGFVPLSGRGSVFVSAKIGARRFGGYRGFHGHLFNSGTQTRETRQGFNRGKMPASHFFDNAQQATEQQFIDDSQKNYLEALEKFINKTLPKRNNL